MVSTHALAESRNKLTPDNNRNGVRDYIDDAILADYNNTPQERLAAEQYARSLQALLNTDLSVASQDEIRQLARDNARAILCARQVLGAKRFANLEQKLDLLTYNTEWRIDQYALFMQKLQGLEPQALVDNTCPTGKFSQS